MIRKKKTIEKSQSVIGVHIEVEHYHLPCQLLCSIHLCRFFAWIHFREKFKQRQPFDNMKHRFPRTIQVKWNSRLKTKRAPWSDGVFECHVERRQTIR